jgi:hypothetical protein
MILQSWLLLAAGVVFAGAIGGSYVKGRSDGRALEFAERASIEEVARAAGEASAQAAATAIAGMTVNHTTIRQKTETITREVPVYRDCINDAAVIELLDAARSNRAPAEPASGGSLPGAGADRASHFR